MNIGEKIGHNLGTFLFMLTGMMGMFYGITEVEGWRQIPIFLNGLILFGAAVTVGVSKR